VTKCVHASLLRQYPFSWSYERLHSCVVESEILLERSSSDIDEANSSLEKYFADVTQCQYCSVDSNTSLQHFLGSPKNSMILSAWLERNMRGGRCPAG